MKNHNLKLYWKVILFNFSKFSMYPSEFIAYLLGRFIDLAMLGIFWFVISTANPDLVNFKMILSYFLIIDGLKNIMYSYETRLAKYFQETIENGDISNYLIKPISTIPYITLSYTGRDWINYIYSFFIILLGFLIMPFPGFLNILFCLLFMITGTIIALNFNILIASMNFYNPNADGIRNGINHILRILSGSMVPISLFPSVLKNILLLSPFPATAFMPVYILQTKLPISLIINYFLVTVIWSIILTIITNKIWNHSLKQYESVGI